MILYHPMSKILILRIEGTAQRLGVIFSTNCFRVFYLGFFSYVCRRPSPMHVVFSSICAGINLVSIGLSKVGLSKVQRSNHLGWCQKKDEKKVKLLFQMKWIGMKALPYIKKINNKKVRMKLHIQNSHLGTCKNNPNRRYHGLPPLIIASSLWVGSNARAHNWTSIFFLMSWKKLHVLIIELKSASILTC